MQLNTIYIPCSDESKPHPHLTLIHGWGAESLVWQDWANEQFSQTFNVTLIDLPGFGDSAPLPNSDTIEEDWLQALEDVLPEHTHLLGWSLGGLLAQQVALRNPQRIASLICLASTPRFTQNDGWTRSVSPKIINDFIKAMSLEVTQTLKKFWRLQLQGVDNSKALMKDLVQHMSSRKRPAIKSLNQGLILLKDIDNRSEIKHLTMPTLWLLGEHDPLIPQDIRENLQSLQPQATVQLLQDGSHIPFFSHPQATANAINEFLNTHA